MLLILPSWQEFLKNRPYFDSDFPSSYHPIFLLPFSGKLLKKKKVYAPNIQFIFFYKTCCHECNKNLHYIDWQRPSLKPKFTILSKVEGIPSEGKSDDSSLIIKSLKGASNSNYFWISYSAMGFIPVLVVSRSIFWNMEKITWRHFLKMLNHSNNPSPWEEKVSVSLREVSYRRKHSPTQENAQKMY